MTVDNTTSSKVIETFKEYLEESSVSKEVSKKIKETIEKETINRDEVIDVVKGAESDETTEG